MVAMACSATDDGVRPLPGWLLQGSAAELIAVGGTAAQEEQECQEVWGLTPEQEWALVKQFRDEVELEAGPLQPEFGEPHSAP